MRDGVRAMPFRCRPWWIAVVLATALSLLLYCAQWTSFGLASSRQLPAVPAESCDSCDPSGVLGAEREDGGAVAEPLSADDTRTMQLMEIPKDWFLHLGDPVDCHADPSLTPSNQTIPDVQAPLNLISQSKNPCWWVKGGNESGDGGQPRLSCLPYFFLAGVSKCGSTDIFARLSGHPQVIPPRQKEPRWFDWRRFRSEKFSFDWYVSNFAQAAWQTARDITSFGMSSKVVGDGSPTYFWRNYHWRRYRGNRGCAAEPRELIPDTIYRLLPTTKVIISFRNPVHSLYSKYLAQADSGAYRSPGHFHKAVQSDIALYQDCFARASLRSCIYNVSLSTQAQTRLEKGLYAIFLSDWFRVFPRRQLHIIRFEDYISDIQGHLRSMFLFLELDAMSDHSLSSLAALPPSNQGRHYSAGQMLPATRLILARFYAPFNAHLARLLNDTRFLWSS